MDENEDIKAGQPLAKGDLLVVRDGYAYHPAPGETPTHEATVDCTTNAPGIAARLKVEEPTNQPTNQPTN